MLLTVVGAQAIAMALANPDLAPSTLPETPDMSKPSIRILTPEPNKVYDAKTLSYSITIEKPASWIENHTGYIRSIGYTLDGEKKITIADIDNPSISMSVNETTHQLVFTQNPDYVDLNSENQTITLVGKFSELSKGKHTIQIWVNATSVYHPADTPHNFYGWWATNTEIPVEASSNVMSFSVTNQVAEIEAEPFPTLLTIAVSVTVAAAVAVGVLVYRKKQKRGVST